MKHALLILVSFALGATAAVNEPLRVTVILDFEQKRFGPQAIEGMKAEAAAQLRDTGLKLEWASAEESAVRQDLEEALIFKMRGKCAMDSFPLLPDELGLPLAITHSTEGEILSFGAVDCDRVRSSLKRSMIGRDYSRGEYLYGRALGRALAHEMYHMLAKSSAHAKEGVTRDCLRAQDLISDGLMMPDKSLQAIRKQMALIKKRDGMSPPISDNAIPPASSLP